jgi:virulence-associated protein VapD
MLSVGLIVVSGIREELAERYEDMMAALERGGLVRTTGQTQMNDQSSRSHAIFTIILEMKNRKSSKRRGQVSIVASS